MTAHLALDPVIPKSKAQPCSKKLNPIFALSCLGCVSTICSPKSLTHITAHMIAGGQETRRSVTSGGWWGGEPGLKGKF